MVGEEGAKAREALQPALAADGAQVGQVLGPVVGMRVSRAGGGMKKVEVDAMHGLRPV